MAGQDMTSRRTFLKQALAAGAAGAIAACTGGDRRPTTSDGAAAPEPAAPLTAPAVRRGLTGSISVAYSDELGKKPAYIEAAAEIVRGRNPSATVSLLRQDIAESDFYAALMSGLRNREAPDVIHVSGDRIGELADAGYIVPLDDFLARWPDWKYYPPWVREGVTYQGKVWAVPYGLDTRFLFARRDLLARAGLGRDWQPKNVAGILSAASALRAAVPDASPYALYAGPLGSTGTATHGFVPLVWAYGGDVQDQRGRWVGDSPAIRKTLAYYAEAFSTDGLIPPEILTMPRPWVTMRERLGKGSLGLLFEGGWVYGGWTASDPAGTEKNVAYLLHPSEHEGPSFTVGGAGTCWFITSSSQNPDLAWDYIAAWNTKDTVARLNAEDPHPVARIDAVQSPEYREEEFLVYSTNSLEKARFIPPDASYGKVVTAIQSATARVATGAMSPESAAAAYADDLARMVGPDRVTVQM